MASKLSQKLVWNQSVILGIFLMPKWSFLGTKSDKKMSKIRPELKLFGKKATLQLHR